MPKMQSFICRQCGKHFERAAYDVRAQEKLGHPIRFCSKQCTAAGRPKPAREQPVTLTCEHCGKVFERKASVDRHRRKEGRKRVFCSQECRKAAPAAPRDRPRVTLTCEQCGKSYERIASEVRAQEIAGHPVRYCSRTCIYAAKTAKAWAARQQFTCNYCGKAFELTPAQVSDRSGKSTIGFCSQKCHLAHKKQAGRANQLTLTCDHCGRSFQRAKAEVVSTERKGCKRSFCSKACRKSATQIIEFTCERCGKGFVRSQSSEEAANRKGHEVRFCSRYCHSEHRRENLGESSSGWKHIHRGFRPDLGIVFRSSWEANVARILIAMGVEFEFEPHRFSLSNGLTYLPDFKVYSPNGYYWVEVKGQWNENDRQRLDHFRREFPDELITVVDKPIYKVLAEEWSERIPSWEMRPSSGKAY